ncbi:hypothetical protein [Mesorhizobium sp. AA22]|uniref:hypothetical protein n=1 Tax=Mesorhizobium sp. AA22 TaxID=1854057 RepID=UPI0007ECFB6F|nr:hypothetical protein [Mesorhizobium sp. AA22]QIA23268.1 hypothetical protein A9K68_016935 [Mesorhizobium sp. AA22]
MAKNKRKLPKKIGGFKVPKPVRKSTLLRSLLASSVGRDLLANAITAGAGAAAAVLVRERAEIADATKSAAKTGAKKSARVAGLATEMVQSAASAVMGVVSDAAHKVLPEHKSKGEKHRDSRARRATH